MVPFSATKLLDLIFVYSLSAEVGATCGRSSGGEAEGTPDIVGPMKCAPAMRRSFRTHWFWIPISRGFTPGWYAAIGLKLRVMLILSGALVDQ